MVIILISSAHGARDETQGSPRAGQALYKWDSHNLSWTCVWETQTRYVALAGLGNPRNLPAFAGIIERIEITRKKWEITRVEPYPSNLPALLKGN